MQEGHGIAIYTNDLARSLSGMGHDVVVVTRAKKPEDAGITKRDGAEVHSIREKEPHLPIISGYFPRSVSWLAYSFAVYREIKKINKEKRIDIIETPNWLAEGLFCSLLARIPVVARLHTSPREISESSGVRTIDDSMTIFMHDMQCRLASKLLSSTIKTQKRYQKILGNDGRKIVVAREGRDIDNISGDTPYPQKDKCVLFVGRLEPRKGVDILLRAANRVLRKHPNTRFIIAGKDTGGFGGGRSFTSIFEETIIPIYKRNFIIPGYVSDEKLSKLYDNCSVFAAPSLYESFGLMYVEAMAHSRPVIGTKAGGIPEVVDDGVTGLLVEPANHEALADAIISILSDPAKARKMGLEGRRVATSKFSRQAMAKASVKVYKKMVK